MPQCEHRRTSAATKRKPFAFGGQALGGKMHPLLRRTGGTAATLGCAVGLLLNAAGQAYAATAYGQHCGGPGGGPTWETRGALGAACTANFNASRPGTARIAIDIISSERGELPHMWSFDIHKCDGRLLPSDPPRTFTCDFGPGEHTVYVDRMAAETVNLKVDY
jgi:hypothetical protein